ncbi:MAG: hypothetical protein V7742_21590 [Halioglobus sp.]
MDTVFIIISGVTVFLFGEIIVRFFLGPLHRFKEVKGEISAILLFHANRYGQTYQKLNSVLDEEHADERITAARIEDAKNWNDHLSKASDETRAVAAKLISVCEGIPFYEQLSIVRLVPEKSSIMKSKKHLIGLSNSFSPDQFEYSAESSGRICQLLNIQFRDE